jgi:Domain of unknown function (DUF4394)
MMNILRSLVAHIGFTQGSSRARLGKRLVVIAAAFSISLGVVRPLAAELIYGIAGIGPAGALLTFDSAAPGSILSGSFLTGLQSNETILGIDFRPATGQLYGLGSSSRLYTINPANGAATAVGGQFSTLLNGFSFGFDFNPVIDRIRVVSEADQNLVLNPITGAVQLVATNLAYGAADPNFGVNPNVVDSAYTNNVFNATSTQLYGIDTGLDILVTQANNAGTLGTVGPLGLNASAAGGFDISGVTGIAYAALLPSGSSQSSLYSISLVTGLATNLGVVNGGVVISAMTVAPAPNGDIPEPATAALLLAGLIGVCAVRQRNRLAA